MAKATRRTGSSTPGVEQRRHEELLEIACQVFAEKGFDGASLQDIADRFGILKGSLFHYIQSKNDLLYEIIESVYVEAEKDIWAIIEEQGTATQRLRRLILAYVTYVAEHQLRVTVWLHDLNALEPARRNQIVQFEQRDRSRLSNLVAEAQREGSIAPDTDPLAVSFAMLGAMNWVHRWYRPGRLSPLEIGETVARIYLRDIPEHTVERKPLHRASSGR